MANRKPYEIGERVYLKSRPQIQGVVAACSNLVAPEFVTVIWDGRLTSDRMFSEKVRRVKHE